jgi:hypothetical protein
LATNKLVLDSLGKAITVSAVRQLPSSVSVAGTVVNVSFDPHSSSALLEVRDHGPSVVEVGGIWVRMASFVRIVLRRVCIL